MKNRNGPFIFFLKLTAIGALAIIFLCFGLRAGFKPGKSAVKEAQASPSGSWLAGYGYQKAIVIDNTQNASALSDYQVKVINPLYNETGLVGSWHFAEAAGTTTGTTADSSGNGNNGTLTNFSSPYGIVSSGKFDNGCSFNGSNNYVSLGALTGGTAVQSVSFWVYPSATTNYFIDLNGSAYVSASAGTLSAAGFTSPTIYVNGVVSSAIAANQWQHIVVTTATGINASAANIGKISTNYLNGSIDEVRVYNRALSAAEITALYQAKAKPNYADVQFTKSDGTTTLPFWMEKDGTFWVKASGTNTIPANGTYTMYMYYGNPNATSASNGANTFPAFATGGTITTYQNYRIHTFTSDGTFTPSFSGNVKVLVVAGGGGWNDAMAQVRLSDRYDSTYGDNSRSHRSNGDCGGRAVRTSP